MYFNDVHIAYYIVLAILGLFIGQFVDWSIKQLSKEKRVLTLDIFKEYKLEFKPKYILMFLTSIIYVTLLYIYGIKSTLIANLDLLKFLIITPILLSAFVIDYKLQIIPNRLNLTLFEIGLGFVFLYGLSDIAISINMILGMFVGAGIFLLITLIGGLIYGKEAMGFGDVKIMGALGLFFGLSNIIVVTLMAFLIGAILSIILLITKIKKSNEYIPFGPFIVIATFISMYVPFEVIKDVLWGEIYESEITMFKK
ncbi:MAG: A24 family peptidase [Clostridia bacterium]